MKRERWSSRTIFLFASIGSAVGLGNVWRFPYLAGKYGGGAFLIPYFLMLFILGIPLLILEFAIGQKMQLGAVGSFKKIKTKLSGVGFAAVFCGFIVCSYYCVIMAWSTLYLIFSPNTAWGEDTNQFFFEKVLHITPAGDIGFVVTPVIFALALVWVLIYFSIWKGIKSVSKVVTVTMPLPIILVVILGIRGITLENGIEGLKYYITPSFETLFSGEMWMDVWAAAASQIFFTLSIAFGIMIAYASYKHQASDISKNAIITSITNSAISLLSGFAVFTTLGYMAYKSGDSIEALAQTGVPLSFVVFPKALSLMPFAPGLFAALFFIMLLSLGIDSAFSLVEAVSTAVHDKYPHIRKQDVSLYVCIAGFIIGIIFTTTAGLIYLDTTDNFITNYGLVIVGLLEVIVVGWLYGAEKLRAYINEVSEIKIGKWWSFTITVIIPIILIALLVFKFTKDIKAPYEGYPNWVIWLFGWGMLIFVFALSGLLSLLSKHEEPKETIRPDTSVID